MHKILVDSKDREIINLSEVLVDLAQAISQKQPAICLDFNSEGPDVAEISYWVQHNLLNILKNLKSGAGYPVEIFIKSSNLIHDKSQWPDFILDYDGKSTAGKDFLGLQKKIHQTSNHKNLRTYGCFVSSVTYPRLIISSHLYNNHYDKTFQTFRKDYSKAHDAVNFKLDRLLFEITKSKNKDKILENVFTFLPRTPIKKENIDLGDTIQFFHDDASKEILSWYDNFFVDIVCETFFSGKTFYPTEKIARPLAKKTPFIVQGPKNFLRNLRRLGFKTFDKFWSEDYDRYEGITRVDMIIEQIDRLAHLDNVQLNRLLEKMKDILQHNKDTYSQLTFKKINDVFE